MVFERCDPAHLFALHMLLEEGSVTRAAKRLGITQSSMSHRLARLRDALGDPLFVRQGARLLPTQRAGVMKEPLARALAALDEAVSPPGMFDPKTSRFRLRLFLPDLLAPALPRLMQALTSEAKLLDVEVASLPSDLSQALASTAPSLALAPSHFVGNAIMAKTMGELAFGVLGRRGHPALKRALTLDRWLSYRHVVVSVGNPTTNLIEDALAKRGLQRRVGLVVPSFLTALFAVSQSDMLMNAPMPLVAEAKRALKLTLRETPIALPTVRFALSWHPRFQHDAAHRWTRERLFGAVRAMFQAL